MLHTPFGTIKLTFDGQPVSYVKAAVKNKELFPDVDGAFIIRYAYLRDGKQHVLQCVLDLPGAAGATESGERLEAISFYEKEDKLTIGCEGWFGFHEIYKYDYDGSYLPNGLEIDILPQTKSRDFIFGVAWLNQNTEKKDVQTWFAADPTISWLDAAR